MSFTPITVLFLTASLDTIKVLYFSRLQQVCLFHICHNSVSYGFTGHYLVFTSAAGLSFSHLSQFCFLLLQWTLLYFSHLQQVCLSHLSQFCFLLLHWTLLKYYVFHVCNRSVFFTSVTILFLTASLGTFITSKRVLHFYSIAARYYVFGIHHSCLFTVSLDFVCVCFV